MPRHSRMVAIGYPHHITQRGNNREPVFFDDEDRFTYLNLLEHYSGKFQLTIWAYCLMTNHVHLLIVPNEDETLSKGVGLVHLAYTRHVNRKYKRTGRLWQNRFFSSIVDTDSYLWAVARYIENNPVAAGMVEGAGEYEWSSARHHLGYNSDADPLLKDSSWLSQADCESYQNFLGEDGRRMATMINHATRNGKPICSPERLSHFEELCNRIF
ncbi:MAG: transposase [Desulfuromonadales bacterium]|nr:transposase [Desulfuromonadales bacterium]